MKKQLLLAVAGSLCVLSAVAQNRPKPADTEFYTPVPPVITPGPGLGTAPSDALVLFDGKNLDEWVTTDNHSPVTWTVENGTMKVNKTGGNIETKKSFGNYQLHLEFKIPESITGEGQARGNSGLFLASIGKGDAGYEVQIMDAYNNKTYTNGQAGAVYKQSPPMVNPNRKPGEWQTYDVIWTAPVFNADGTVKSPAYVTLLFNGVLVQNHFELTGPTQYIGKATYNKPHGPAPIKLQAHGDASEPISFRNIWIREYTTLVQPAAK
ncbi:3-keto-disaccharide hydrolase [Mucilaginibacter myungsuensis]|uniref:DUF1080 domain-containing protein n=1 Tax=Mucilaginibacter myungsuensis TaxID=649104 RepID=A0A929PWH9_9SPHI|nr:DUF1080 domain-containing protein [Mucilaginibacter myungsuensis]MBE9662853.1 DUF1080 domain-containing protein [Mucilaginibacter myungsuensis]MDN3598273.1 DUF1080 domain-containing protein [Mucilaginibacter myungsuensis]